MGILDVAAITVAGLLVGNELAIAVFVHPVLRRQTDDVHLAASVALAKVLGRAMPFWYALVTLLTGVVAGMEFWRTGRWPALLVGSTVVWVVAIVFTIAALVPINNQVAGWTNESKPVDWKGLRGRWDTLHGWRVGLLTVALVLLVGGVLRQGLLC